MYLSRNCTLKTVVKISRVPLDRFCSNLQGLFRKVLSSKLGELFKKNLFSFYLKKTDGKWGQNFQKKILNTCYLPKKARFCNNNQLFVLI